MVSGLVLLADLASKHVALTSLSPYEPYPLTFFFNLTLAFNRGAAFSLLSTGSGWQTLFFLAIALVVSAVMLVWLFRLKSWEWITALAIGLVLGGAWGNVVDRFRFGYVIDFLDIHLAGYHWPTFNVADSAITVGALLLMWVNLKER